MTKLSNAMQRSFTRDERILDQMYEQKIRVNKNKENISLSTKEQYKEKIKEFLKEVNEEFNISNFEKIKDKHFNYIIEQKIDLYHAGKTSEAHNINTLISALNHLNLGIQETRFYPYSKKFKIGDIPATREKLKEEGVVRRSKYSQVLRANEAQGRKVLENILSQGYKTKTRQIAHDVGFIALKSGGRVTNTLALKKRDFKRLSEEKGEVTFFNDKGGLTRTVEVDDELITFLENLTEDLNDDDYIFDSRKRNGDQKSREEMRKSISAIVKEAGQEFGKVSTFKEKNKEGKEIEKKVNVSFTTHSFRKAFALERASEYYQALSSDKKMREILFQKFDDNKKVEEKYYSQLRRINEKRKEDREMTRDELAIFLTSVDLGHFRTDVINMYYCNIQEVKKHLANK